MNKILIVQFTVGPTHKARLLHNLNTYPAYNRFDVLILTNDVEFFDSVSDRSNIILKDINEIRKDYPWSLELEVIPKEKVDEAAYATEFIEENIKIPTLIRRWAWKWENFTNYEGFIFMDCDILPVMDDEWYQKIETFFTTPFTKHPIYDLGENLENKIIMTPAGSSYDENHIPHLREFAHSINNDYKITDKEITDHFVVMDGNFRAFKFPDKSMIIPFFELLNNVVYDVLVRKKEEYFIFGVHSMWNVHSEYILSVLFNLMGIITFEWNEDIGFHPYRSFRTTSYPEDRFWNWGQNFEMSRIGKQDFIEKNYEKLKKYYIDHSQEFPY
jgi:hypothetical protein